MERSSDSGTIRKLTEIVDQVLRQHGMLPPEPKPMNPAIIDKVLEFLRVELGNMLLFVTMLVCLKYGEKSMALAAFTGLCVRLEARRYPRKDSGHG